MFNTLLLLCESMCGEKVTIFFRLIQREREVGIIEWRQKLNRGHKKISTQKCRLSLETQYIVNLQYFG